MEYILVHFSEYVFEVYPDNISTRERFKNIFELKGFESVFTKNKISNNAVVCLIQRALFRKAKKLLDFMFNNFKLSNSYITDVILNFLEMGEWHSAEYAYNSAKEKISFNDDEILHKIEDMKEWDVLQHNVYPSSVPINERYVKPRLAPNKYNNLDLIKWQPGVAYYHDAYKIIVLFFVDGNFRTSYTMFRAEYSVNEWFNLTGEHIDEEYKEDKKFHVEIGYYSDNETDDRIFVDKEAK